MFFLFKNSYSQDSLPYIVFLNEVDITVNDTSLKVDDFIEIIKNDTTFYKSFKYLRYYSHNFSSNLSIFFAFNFSNIFSSSVDISFAPSTHLLLTYAPFAVLLHMYFFLIS